MTLTAYAEQVGKAVAWAFECHAQKESETAGVTDQEHLAAWRRGYTDEVPEPQETEETPYCRCGGC